MHAFTIKDLENLSGIKAHTIRIWEQRYSFLNPSRTDTNIRFYSNDELKTVLNIALLNKYGFKISHIDRMSTTEIKEKILCLSQMEAQQERIINEMIHTMVDMRLDSFEKLLDENMSLRGIEKTITQLIFPFMERIGILWLTNHINPAQEHLVTNIIRQKLIVGIDGIHTLLNSKSLILLFLPEGEHHELGLLFVYYLMKRRGVNVIYLGSNVPVKDMEYVAKLKQPDAIFTHLTSVANHFNFEKFLNNMHARLPDLPLVISGQITQGYKKKAPNNTQFKKTLSEVMDFIGMIA